MLWLIATLIVGTNAYMGFHPSACPRIVTASPVISIASIDSHPSTGSTTATPTVTVLPLDSTASCKSSNLKTCGSYAARPPPLTGTTSVPVALSHAPSPSNRPASELTPRTGPRVGEPVSPLSVIRLPAGMSVLKDSVTVSSVTVPTSSTDPRKWCLWQPAAKQDR